MVMRRVTIITAIPLTGADSINNDNHHNSTITIMKSRTPH